MQDIFKAIAYSGKKRYNDNNMIESRQKLVSLWRETE